MFSSIKCELMSQTRMYVSAHLQNEHILSEVITVFENDAYGVFGQSCGVGPDELQPQGFLLGCHHFALFNLHSHKKSFIMPCESKWWIQKWLWGSVRGFPLTSRAPALSPGS